MTEKVHARLEAIEGGLERIHQTLDRIAAATIVDGLEYGIHPADALRSADVAKLIDRSTQSVRLWILAGRFGEIGRDAWRGEGGRWFVRGAAVLRVLRQLKRGA